MLHIRQLFNICQRSKSLRTTNTDFVEVEIFIVLFTFSIYTWCNQVCRIINAAIEESSFICFLVFTILRIFYSVRIGIEWYRVLLYKC